LDILQQIGVERWRLKKGLDSKPILATEFAVKVSVAAKLGSEEIIPEVSELSAINVAKGGDTSAGQSQSAGADSENSLSSWSGLEASLNDPAHCQSCAESNAILGEGDATADWVFVMDAPSSQDSQLQQLLSGRNGQLFDAILRSINLSREVVYLTSIFKCPPPDEVAISPQCGRIVDQQLMHIKPRVVVALGEFAAQTLIRSNHDLAFLRGANPQPISTDYSLIASHCMASMLETPSLKAEFWHDLKKCLH